MALIAFKTHRSVNFTKPILLAFMKKDLQSVIRSGLKLTLFVALLIMVLVTTTLFQVITGFIVNKNGDKLAGVIVQVRGTTVSTATYARNNFLINASGKPELIFSSVRFKFQEITVGGKKEI